MVGVVKKFFVASMFMWILPTAFLFGFKHNIFPGSIHLSSQSQTLLSGFLAFISINIVIAFYICMAMKESSDRHVPDSAFLAGAKATIRKSTPVENEESSQDCSKEEYIIGKIDRDFSYSGFGLQEITDL